MKIIPYQNNSEEVIRETVKVLQAGGLVIFPSDTVYGALVDATNESAVKKLINFKNRPPGKAISVFVESIKDLAKYVNLKAEKELLLKQMLPGPFTIILPSKQQTSPLLESEKKTLGVRVPQYPLITDLIASFGKPTSATSANLGGKSPHYSVESLLNQLPEHKKELIDLIIDAGTLPRNKPSTIVDLTESEVKILRHGDIVTTDEESFESDSPIQTRKIAQYILQKSLKNLDEKPVVMILEGDLGAGKTQFVKGIAEYLNITEKIISPTFVIYYEYEVSNHQIKKLLHYDLYNVMEREEFNDLGIEENLKQGHLFCIEWGDKSGDLFTQFKEKANVIFIKIDHVDEGKRTVQIKM